MTIERSESHLEIRNLRVGFETYEGYKQVLGLAHLAVGYGEAVGLVGESGCGKSVLGLSVLRLLRCPPAEVAADSLSFDGRELLALPEDDMRRLRGREIAMIFQDPMSSLNPVFTVGAQLRNVIRRIYGEKGKLATERALHYVRLVGLPDPESTLGKYPHQLSGGQRQRVIIALALCCEAKFIIADEPTRNLDVTVQAGVLKTIAGLRSELGVSLLFIANNLGLVSAMCDRVGVMLKGSIVETGTVDEVVGDARHPYTHMLLRAIPSAEEGGEGFDAVMHAEDSEELATDLDVTEGMCSYYGRCAERTSECSTSGVPALVSIGGTHELACPVMERERVLA